ncbi:SH3 domain-containing protein [Rhodobacterales bacterium HKCCE2091]|nr:SH3 domain-containing protein [Rhodobacterales bacterium HKCCE2091]
MRWLAAFLLLFWPVSAIAQSDLPAIYDVTGVASDDVLNVRVDPDASSGIIGTLAPDATGIEVTGTNADGSWLRLNTGERSGWASARFLQRTGPDWSAGMPAEFTCFGTEPFWSLSNKADGANLGGPAFTAIYDAPWTAPPFGLQPVRFAATWTSGGTLAMSGVIRREQCGDGMSDRDYGLSIVLIRHDTESPTALDGCCAIGSYPP